MATRATHETSAYEVPPPLTLLLTVLALLTWDLIPLSKLLHFTMLLTRIDSVLGSLLLQFRGLRAFFSFIHMHLANLSRSFASFKLYVAFLVL